MVAIIPAAGKGTRMMSVTGGAPKELLRLGRSSVLAKVVAEARDAGADRIVIVSSPEKPQIEDFAATLGSGVEVRYQHEMRGAAHAIACADVEEDALVLLGDAVFHGGSPLRRMSTLIYRGMDGCIAVEPVPDDKVNLYGIVEVDEGTGAIRRILEKPKPEETASRWAVSARYALSGRIMASLRPYIDDALEQEVDGEIGLTPFLNAMIDGGADLKAVALQPGQQRVDCGSPEEYEQARRMEWEG